MSEDRLPLVTVVVPALNEEHDIAGCIQAIGMQRYPLQLVELLVVDGESADSTVEAATAASAAFAFRSFRVLSNPRSDRSGSLNLALAEAAGEILVRVDARARIGPDYVRNTVRALESDASIGVVGGAQVPLPRSGRLIDRGIARALGNRLTTGLSRYRLRGSDGPSDTVWLGVFRSAELREIGGWKEEYNDANEDWELNARYRARGRLVWFLAGEQSGYLARTSYRALARQYFTFGRVKGRAWSSGDQRPVPRQLVLMAVPLVAAFGLWRGRRRFGRGVWLAPAAVLAVADDLGSDAPPADLAERLASFAAIATYAGAWWSGVWVGALGDGLRMRSPTNGGDGSAARRPDGARSAER